MQFGNRALAAVVVCALLGCKTGKESPSTEPARPTSTTTGATAPTAAPEASTTAVAKGPSYKIGGVPDIPSAKSNPPVGSEWDQGVAVNTQGASARAKRCSMHVLRDWLRIYCTGKVIGYEKKTDFGTLGGDYYERIEAGKYASLVVRLKKGKNQMIRICRETDRASLFVSWPVTADKPKNIALGTGPVCDGSDWGAGYGKGGSDAMKAQPGTAPPDAYGDDDAMRAADKKASEDCKNGDSDACIFFCGAPSC
jgi:hypothetical protein